MPTKKMAEGKMFTYLPEYCEEIGRVNEEGEQEVGIYYEESGFHSRPRANEEDTNEKFKGVLYAFCALAGDSQRADASARQICDFVRTWGYLGKGKPIEKAMNVDFEFSLLNEKPLIHAKKGDVHQLNGESPSTQLKHRWNENGSLVIEGWKQEVRVFFEPVSLYHQYAQKFLSVLRLAIIVKKEGTAETNLEDWRMILPGLVNDETLKNDEGLRSYLKGNDLLFISAFLNPLIKEAGYRHEICVDGRALSYREVWVQGSLFPILVKQLIEKVTTAHLAICSECGRIIDYAEESKKRPSTGRETFCCDDCSEKYHAKEKPPMMKRKYYRDKAEREKGLPPE